MRLPQEFWLCVTEYPSKLLLSVLRACVSVSHPEGLIETVVLVLVRKSPFLWMEGYNLSATQHTTGNSSNSTSEPPLKDKYCISTVHMDTQGISALFSKHFKNGHKHTHSLSLSRTCTFAWLSTKQQTCLYITHKHTREHAQTHPARD